MGAHQPFPVARDGDGGFPRTIEDLWDHGDVDEVRKEGRAQVERAIYWGFDVSHLDSHIGALFGRPEFFDAYLELALEFGLPLRLPGEATQRLVGFPFRKLAAEEGAVFPDHLVAVPRELTGRGGARRAIDRALFELAPGVTEIQTHPAIDTDELRAACPDWPGRVEDRAYLRHDPSLSDLIERAGATLIGYRDLRALVRAAAA